MRITLDGSVAATLPAPDLARWRTCAGRRRRREARDLDTLTPAGSRGGSPAETLLLSGEDATGRRRAQAHRDLSRRTKDWPPAWISRNRVIYYVGPRRSGGGRDRRARPAPTTSTRMDKFTEMMASRGPASSR